VPRPLRSVRSGLTGVALAITFALALSACSSGSSAGARASDLARPSTVAITVHATGPGAHLTPGFLGLALEAWSLSRNQFTGTNFADYLKLLGPHGVLRIGGNSLDESFWTSTGEPRPAWATQGTVTPAALHALARVLAGTGWRVDLGVNLKHFDPARAADEARFAHQILGSSLAAIGIGNEPDDYGISEATYFRNFESYVRAIRAAVPGVALAGPEAASRDLPWVSAFARDETPHPDVALVTSHEYPLSICSGQHPTIAQLLSTASADQEVAAADTVAAAGRTLHVPAAIDETNSVVCWGAPGVSNVYASALWTLDYALLLADHGVGAVNFQGRIRGCKPYIPLCSTGSSAQLTAQPDFYGLLAVGLVGSGRFLSVTDPASAQLRAYAVQTGVHGLSIVLDNLGGATHVALRLPRSTYSGGRQTVLATGSPLGLRATRGISLGGRQVGANGHFGAPGSSRVTVTGSTVGLELRAHTAVILRLS
jgi:hypothetical protein